MSTSISIPAYKEPWFWMVIGPLLLVVVVAFTLLGFAVVGADDRVVDDYYKEGRMINSRFELQRNALALAVRGDIQFSDKMDAATLHLAGRSNPAQVILKLSHPSQSALDLSMTLDRQSPGVYSASIPTELNGRWYLSIEAEESETETPWRVTTEMDFRYSRDVTFTAHQ